MAAYASLLSVMDIIDNLQLHSRPPITLHKQQAHLLTQKITFLQEFLEIYNPNLPYSKEADPLETRVARAAYAAEDAIESHILDQFANNDGEKMNSDSLCEALANVIEDMALIEKEAMDIKETVGFQNQLHAKSTAPADSSRSSSSPIAQKSISMVGADDMLLPMKDKLASDRPELQTIPIVGMGGSGKTTLALNIYHDRLVVERFDIRAWVTISQEYNIQEILIQLLTQLINKPNKGLSEGELGEMLYKHLCGKRFMIILDDMWSVHAWGELKWFLPDNKNGSRVVVTTRLTTLAYALPNSDSLWMKLLNEDDSWDLLSKTMFGEKGCCPSGFEEIGKKIGRSCKGLPLSIILVGGLLAKSQTREFWEHMEKNLNAIVNLEDDERCLKTLYLSYKQLPVHLKPCFLYMGIFREDYEIRVSKLVKLWVAEGFLKPVKGERPEDVARVYLKDLIDRNLILVHQMGSTGNIKECKVHDLLRDLCLREAEKERFYAVVARPPNNQETDNGQRRIVIPSSTSESEAKNALWAMPLARSLVWNLEYTELPPLSCLRLLRIFDSCKSRLVSHTEFLDNMPQFVNLRFLAILAESLPPTTKFPSSIWLFWNLQTLIVDVFDKVTAPSHIWNMYRIRHLQFLNLSLPDPPTGQEGIVLGNMQTLRRIRNFKCSQEVVKRIPNIKKLQIIYFEGLDERHCLANLACLHKLESLYLSCPQEMNPSGRRVINFPHLLMKLSLRFDESRCWEDILDKIGSLPLLQKLKLVGGSFKEGQWETREGHFRNLRFLAVRWCENLQFWKTESSHFPCLDHLVLEYLYELKDIPLEFAEISMLRVIHVERCRDSVVLSAKRISEEQEALHGEEAALHVLVRLRWKDEALESLAGPNFRVVW